MDALGTQQIDSEISKIKEAFPDVIELKEEIKNPDPVKYYDQIRDQNSDLPERMPSRLVSLYRRPKSQNIAISYWSPEITAFVNGEVFVKECFKSIKKIIKQIDSSTQEIVSKIANEIVLNCEYRLIRAGEDEKMVTLDDFDEKPGEQMILVNNISSAVHRRTLFYRSADGESIEEKDFTQVCQQGLTRAIHTNRRLAHEQTCLIFNCFVHFLKQKSIYLDDNHSSDLKRFPPVLLNKAFEYEFKISMALFDPIKGSYFKVNCWDLIVEDIERIKKIIDEYIVEVNRRCKRVYDEQVKRNYGTLPVPLNEQTHLYLSQSDWNSEMKITYIYPDEPNPHETFVQMHEPTVKKVVDNINHAWKIHEAIEELLKTKRPAKHVRAGEPKELLEQEPFVNFRDALGIIWVSGYNHIHLFMRDSLNSSEAIERVCTLEEMGHTIKVLDKVRRFGRKKKEHVETLDQSLQSFTTVKQQELMRVWSVVERAHLSVIKHPLPQDEKGPLTLYIEGQEFFMVDKKFYMIVPGSEFPRAAQEGSSMKVIYLATRIDKLSRIITEGAKVWMTCQGHDDEAGAKYCKNEERVLNKIAEKNLQEKFLVRKVFVHHFKKSAKTDKCGFMLEFCSGGRFTFENLVVKKLTLKQRVELYRQAAIGYQTLHDELNEIHCDIKPPNILLKKNSQGQYEIRVIDFGLSKPRDYDGEDSRKGTPIWYAPELVALRDKTYNTTASDVFSFGLVGLESVLGIENPLVKFKTWDELYGFLREDQKSFSGLHQDYTLNYPLIDLISKMTFKNPKLRPTMKEVAGELDRILKSESELNALAKLYENISNLRQDSGF